MNQTDHITDDQVVARAKAAVKLAIEKKNITNAPVVTYDRKSGKICVKNTSESTIIERKTKGRYSERISNKKA